VLFSKLVEVIDPEPHSAALNMAIDEILLRQAERPALRVYRWSEPAVSFGYFEKVSTAEAIAAGRAAVRRWTGGGIVEHGEDLTYTLFIPQGHPFLRHAASETYRQIHETIAGFLVGAGMRAEVLSASHASVSRACFASPVQHDLVADGIKVAGAAQRRTRWGLLHQGSIRAPLFREGECENLAEAFCASPMREPLTPATRDAGIALAAVKYGTAEWLRKF